MKKEAKTEVSKIILTIAGKEITCTPQQIRELKAALEKMFPTPPNPLHEYLREMDRKPYRPLIPNWNDPWCMTSQVGEVQLEAK